MRGWHGRRRRAQKGEERGDNMGSPDSSSARNAGAIIVGDARLAWK